jgi:hypothetical protein
MLLTGIAPFGGTAGADMERVLERQLGPPPIAPSRLRRDLPPAADQVLFKALLADSQRRFASATVFAEALSGALATPVRLLPPDAAVPLVVSGAIPPRAVALGALIGHRPRRVTLPAAGPAASRGALFRVAYRVLGNRLGGAWLAQIIDAEPALAKVLRNDLSPSDWQPTALLTSVCKAVPREVRDPRKVARELARAAMVQTLAGLLGHDPASDGTRALVEDLPTILKRYHSWAAARVGFGERAARVELVGVPPDQTLAWYLEGMIERIAELGGAASARARLVESELEGKPATLIDVHWQE